MTGSAITILAAITLFLLLVVGEGSSRVLVVILSDLRPVSAGQRSPVRETWLSLGRPADLQHAFCVGRSPDSGAALEIGWEASQFSDLLLVDALDEYAFLAQKTFACLQAAHAGFSGKFDFLIKTDHDVFLRVDVLVDELSILLSQHSMSHTTVPLLHWQGFVYHSIPPMRDLADKNADVSNTRETFPPYTAGVAYVLSEAVVENLQQGLFACDGIMMPSCCLCCACDDVRQSWFRCDERGASLLDTTPLSMALTARDISSLAVEVQVGLISGGIGILLSAEK